jgi:hypothetical protein
VLAYTPGLQRDTRTSAHQLCSCPATVSAAMP